MGACTAAACGGIFRPPRSRWSGGSFPPCWNVSPTSTVRTIWRADPGRWSEPKPMTGVAIVIPMLNEAAGLPRLLRSLAALEPPSAEVLAVDGGSTDASATAVPAATLPARRAAAIRRPRHVLPPRRFPGRRRLRPQAAGHGGGGFVHPLPPARPNPPRQPRGDHLRSPGRRLGRAAGELDLPQGRSTLGARLSQRAGAALPRRALNRSPAQIACGDAVVDQPLQEAYRGAADRAAWWRQAVVPTRWRGHVAIARDGDI